MTSQPLAPVGPPLRPDQVARYSRHLLLPEIGDLGQRRLTGARVLVVGAGGLGTPVLSYLAAASVGQLTIIDDDTVDVSNLQRQVIHRDADVGTAKVASAVRAVTELNPSVQITPIEQLLTADNALPLFADHDVVVDATDNFATRYLVNDACVLLGLPLVWGAIHRFDGQVAVWWANEHPCYRCIFPDPPPAGAVPSCAEGGVLGAIPGVIGSIQATEVVKLLLGVGQPLVGRLVLHNALTGTWSTVSVACDPACAVCGEVPTITSLVDSARSCMLPTAKAASTIEACELAALVASGAPVQVVDVRTDVERSIATLSFSIHVELARVRDGLGAGDIGASDNPVVFYCKNGVRSAEAVQLMRETTGIQARSLDGGILAWIANVDPTLTTY